MSSLDSLYKEFFSNPNQTSNQQIELKNRCFKDLYNLIEDCTFKFYDLYVSYNSTTAKNEKLESTFQQLEQVFSGSGIDQDKESGDMSVLEELKRISNNNLQDIFELQKEIAHFKALENVPIQLVKLLKKSYEKTGKKQNNVSGILSLEEQVMELNQKLKDQDKIYRNKEKKMNKKKEGQRN